MPGGGRTTATPACQIVMDRPLFQKFAGVEPAKRLLEAVRFNRSLDDVYLVAVMDDDVGLGPHVRG
ncbi:unannotated protein [freshwater metagenome]|uniref:Unannotated protein n=1 Tax=freshwater metagenome TaxID=449393 RepID=A0A6J6ZY87_9ZZZZ